MFYVNQNVHVRMWHFSKFALKGKFFIAYQTWLSFLQLECQAHVSALYNIQ